MKKVIFSLIVTGMVVVYNLQAQNPYGCDTALIKRMEKECVGEYTYIKDLQFHVSKSDTVKQTLIFRENFIYEFKLLTSKKFSSEVEVKFASKKDVHFIFSSKQPVMKFACEKTQAYHFLTSLAKGEEACGMILIRFVGKQEEGSNVK